MILSTFLHYPNQAVWQLIAVSRSSNHLRKTRCLEIVEKVKSNAEVKEIWKVSAFLI
jgi:serine/threonine-protein kinase ATR